MSQSDAKRAFDAQWGNSSFGFYRVWAAALPMMESGVFYCAVYYFGNCLSSLNGYYEHLNANPMRDGMGVSTIINFIIGCGSANGYHLTPLPPATALDEDATSFTSR